MDYEALRRVGEELRKLSPAELRAKIEKHKGGDIANLLLEGGFCAINSCKACGYKYECKDSKEI